MYKNHDCTKCAKISVCKIKENYNEQALSLSDTDNNYFQSKLHCKYYEEKR